MPEVSLVPPPHRDQLLRQLEARLGDLVPGLRCVARGLLGAGSSIDFVGVEPAGRVVLVLVGDAGTASDLELVGRAVAQRAWVEPRLRDWLQLAPSLGIQPEAGVRVVLLCPDFGPETITAAHALGADAVCLARFRCLRNGAGTEAVLEGVFGAQARHAGAGVAAEPAPGDAPFRTGLTDAELGLSPEEFAEFE